MVIIIQYLKIQNKLDKSNESFDCAKLFELFSQFQINFRKLADGYSENLF